MAIETINIGTSPNDGTGDPLRVAFDKTNDNFLTITADGGNEITVLNPTTATDTDLNVALQDILDAGTGGAVDSVNGQTGVVSIDLESVLTEGNRPIKSVDNNSAYDFIAEDKGKFLIATGTEPLTLNADIFDEGDTLLVIAEAIDIQIVQGAGVTLKGNGGNAGDFTLRLGEMALLTNDNLNAWWVNIIPQITSQTIPQTTSFTAEVDLRYTANGTLTVTDPTPISNKGYIVHVIGGSVTIGGTAYTSGALVYRYYDGSVWISTSLANSTQLALKANLVSPALTGTPTAPTQSANDNSTKIATTAYADAKVQNSLSASTTIAPSATAVNTALDLKSNVNRSETFIFSKANGTFGSHTGNTSETVILTSSITGGVFEIGDWLNLMYDFTVVGTAGTKTIRFRAGTTGTTADALIGTLFLTATALDSGWSRERMQFKTGNILSGIANNYTSNPFDIAPNTVAKQSTSLNPANTWILSVSVQLVNSADTVSCEGYVISRVKSF